MSVSRAEGGRRRPPAAPGEVLRERFLAPRKLSARDLARDLGVPTVRITRILRGAGPVTASVAILLARRFDTTPRFWLDLQSAHDVAGAREAMAGAARRGRAARPRRGPAMTRRPLLSAHALGTLREVARGPVPRTPPGNRVAVADLLQRRLVEVVPARSPAPAAGGRAATACLRITRAGLRVLGGGPEAVPAG